MNPDGWVVIGTKVDDTGFKKGMKKLENQEVEADVEIDPELQGYEWLAQMAERRAQELSEKMTIEPRVEVQEVYSQLSEAYLQSAEIMRQMQELSMNPTDDIGPLLDLVNQLDVVSTTIDELETKADKLTGAVNQDVAQIKKSVLDLNTTTKQIESNLSKIGKGITGIIGKVGRWAVAVIGVYSAYSFVRQSMSTLAQYNKKLASDLEYIRFAIANTLAPVIDFIVKLIYKALYYTGYLLKAWFGIDIFANSSVSAFQKAKESLKSSAKSAKEINKQLAGFDEMNVLTDNSGGSGASGGGDGFTSPSYDLSKMQGDVPAWLEWIRKHGPLIKDILEIILALLLGIKLGLTGLGQFFGLFLVIDGVINLIKDLKKYIEDPSWYNFANVLRDIGEILVGLAFIVGITSPLGIILAIIGQLAIMIGGIIKTIKNLKIWLEKPTWTNFKKLLNDSLDNLGVIGILIRKIFDLFGGFDKVVEPFHKFYDWAMQKLLPNLKEKFINLGEKIKEIFGPIGDFFKRTFNTAYRNIKTIVKDIKLLFSVLYTDIKKIFEPVIKFFREKFDKVYTAITQALNPIIKFFGDLWTKIKNKIHDWGVKAGEIVGGALKAVVNSILSHIETVINRPITTINSLITKIRKVPGLSKLETLDTFKLPRLARGGIVNNPGAGVFMGNYIAGENGPEAVLPLNDETYERLGMAIAKYSSVNATIPVYVGNRQVAREIRKINAESDFAFNR